MLDTTIQMLFVFAVFGVAVIVLFFDVFYQKIPNSVSFGTAVLGLIMNGIVFGVYGIFLAFFGILTAFFMLIPLYIFKGLRAGDVKILSGVGALLGVKVAWVVLLSMIFSALIGIAILVFNQGMSSLFFRYKTMILTLFYQRKFRYLAPTGKDPALIQFPFAIPIFLGVLVCSFYRLI